MKTFLSTLICCCALVANSEIVISGGSGGSIDTNNPLAFNSSVYTPVLYVGSLAYAMSNTYSGSPVIVGLTNSTLYQVIVTNDVTLRITNFSPGASCSVFLSAGGTGRTVTYIWPKDVYVDWLNPANTVVTNTTAVGFFCETNYFGTNRVMAKSSDPINVPSIMLTMSNDIFTAAQTYAAGTTNNSLMRTNDGITKLRLDSLNLGAFTNIVCGRIPIMATNGVTYYITISTNAL